MKSRGGTSCSSSNERGILRRPRSSERHSLSIGSNWTRLRTWLGWMALTMKSIWSVRRRCMNGITCRLIWLRARASFRFQSWNSLRMMTYLRLSINLIMSQTKSNHREPMEESEIVTSAKHWQSVPSKAVEFSYSVWIRYLSLRRTSKSLKTKISVRSEAVLIRIARRQYWGKWRYYQTCQVVTHPKSTH